MINVYNIFDYYDYVCTHQKGIERALRNNNLFDVQALNPLTIEETCSTLKGKHSNLILVWDLRRMSLADAGRQLISVLIPIKEKVYKGICFLTDSNGHELLDRISKEAEEYCKENDKYEIMNIAEGCCFCGEKNLYEEKLKDHINNQNVFIAIDNDINYHIFNYLTADGKREWKPNPSSNIYVNQYFDAKKMLTDGAIYNLIIYRMALLIKESLIIFSTDKNGNIVESEQEFDAFVCASLTGSCLASGLSAIFHKPIVYLKNVGPLISAKDERLIARIIKNKRYVFVFDFMCLGKEYERMKLICNLRSAKIICCSGISYYRFPRFKEVDKKMGKYVNCCFDWNEELHISSLFQINTFNKNYYTCSVTKESEKE